MFAGGLTQQSVTGWTAWGRQNSNPQFQDPLVSDCAHQLLDDRRHATRSRPATSTSASTPTSTTSTRSTASDTYGGQFSRPAGAAADPATYNLADFLFGARNQYDLVNPFVFQLRQRMHFAYLQDDWRVTPALTLNLGLRYEFGTPQWEDDNFLTNFDPATQHAAPGARRLGLRSRARQPRQEQLRAAHRRRLQPQREDRHPRGLRHRATSSSTGWAARTCCRSTVRTWCRSPSRSSRRRGSARRQPGADDLLPPDPGRLSRKASTVPANFNPINGRVNYIPPDNEDRQHPELARHGAARAVAASSSSTSPTSATAAAT